MNIENELKNIKERLDKLENKKNYNRIGCGYNYCSTREYSVGRECFFPGNYGGQLSV